MGKQTFDRIKKTIAILMAIFFVVTLTAASASAGDGRDWGHGDWGHGWGHGNWGHGWDHGWDHGWGHGWGHNCGWWNNWCRWGHGW